MGGVAHGMATSLKKKTVAFFEVFDSEGQPLSAALPWDAFLAELEKQSVEQRQHRLWNTIHWASAYPYQERNHFVLARSREDAPSTLDVATGEFIDHENDIQRPWVEISVASFIEGTNKFGYVLGSSASPRVSSMEEWINKHEIFDSPISIGPAVNPNVLARLNGAAQVKLLSVKLARGEVGNIPQGHGIFTAARSLSEDYGDVDIEIIVKVAGQVTPQYDSEREGLLDAARGLLGHDFKKAVAELLSFDDRGRPETEMVNLLNDRLATKMKVSVTDAEGNPIRIQSAIAAIYRATDKFKAEQLL
jgi:hypothetical protein